MTQLAIVRVRLRRRRVVQGTEGRWAPSAAKVSLRPRTLVGLALLLGLATGLIELVMHLARRFFINPSSLGALQLNQHALWTVPVSDALIFGVCGLIVATTAVITRSSRISVVGLFGLCFLSALAFLLTFRGLSAVACSTLSAGVATPANQANSGQSAASRPLSPDRSAGACRFGGGLVLLESRAGKAG